MNSLLNPDLSFASNPRYAQIALDVDGRTFLGDVVEGFYDDAGNARLRVKHFNGEPWSFSPLAVSVTVLGP